MSMSKILIKINILIMYNTLNQIIMKIKLKKNILIKLNKYTFFYKTILHNPPLLQIRK